MRFNKYWQWLPSVRVWASGAASLVFGLCGKLPPASPSLCAVPPSLKREARAQRAARRRGWAPAREDLIGSIGDGCRVPRMAWVRQSLCVWGWRRSDRSRRQWNLVRHLESSQIPEQKRWAKGRRACSWLSRMHKEWFSLVFYLGLGNGGGQGFLQSIHFGGGCGCIWHSWFSCEMDDVLWGLEHEKLSFPPHPTRLVELPFEPLQVFSLPLVLIIKAAPGFS